jgi:acetate kinase
MRTLNILVFNCGSSSLTFKVFETSNDAVLRVVLSGKAHRVGVKGTNPSFLEYKYDGKTIKDERPLVDHGQAAQILLEKIASLDLKIDSVGHRWGQAAGNFNTNFINAEVLKTLKKLVPIMPIHHPAMLKAILAARKKYPKLPQYVTADGAFHHTIPPVAYTYALPPDLVARFGFRKHGFHGLSYQYVSGASAKFISRPLESLKMIACHLGTGGSSVCAISKGKSIDTSMGYTGLPGLMMSTRCGDLDPMLALYLMMVHGYRPDDLSDILNKKSGLLGISGFSSDIRDIVARVFREERAELALKMYVHKICQYIGSYVTLLGGLDVLVFTDDIGQRNPTVRAMVTSDMSWCGIKLDEEVNASISGNEAMVISSKASKVKVLAMPTEEELVICEEALALFKRNPEHEGRGSR